ncbi:hypothetical protein BDZ89DRAFT_1069400, partial [Hymenopellis radicata]
MLPHFLSTSKQENTIPRAAHLVYRACTGRSKNGLVETVISNTYGLRRPRFVTPPPCAASSSLS